MLEILSPNYETSTPHRLACLHTAGKFEWFLQLRPQAQHLYLTKATIAGWGDRSKQKRQNIQSLLTWF